jgi:hypothetical protein
MRFTVEPWAPEYGAPVDAALEEPSAAPNVDVEMAARGWRPLRPQVPVAADVLFVDGVRRVDANIWIDRPGDLPMLGVCATYAAGAVRCCEARATIEAARVERGVFSAAPGAEEVVTAIAVYGVRAVSGETPEELWLGVQQRMGELEHEVTAGLGPADLTVVDGPLTGRQHLPRAVGLVKTHRVMYLPPALRPVLGDLAAGERSPLFVTTTAWSRYSWYVRLPGTSGMGLAGVIRCEASADLSVAEAAQWADVVAVTLPRFASSLHKDPRAPQNLSPIGGLERALRRRLGDQHLLYRSLRRSSSI